MKLFPRSRSISLPRRWITDLMAVTRGVPTVGGHQTVSVARVAAARAACPHPISWGAILIRSLGLASRDFPVLREAYMPFPWPHIYRSKVSVASFLVEREYRGERAVFFGLVKQPENKSLRQIDAVLAAAQNGPVEEIGRTRDLLRLSRTPLLIRRLAWLIGLNGYGKLRAHRFGTFSINSVGEVVTTQSATFLPLSVFYNSPDAKGAVNIQAFFDHRLLDALDLRRVLLHVLRVANRQIVAELKEEAARQKRELGEAVDAEEVPASTDT